MCAATCDFHAPNNDEDNREQDTSAMEAMLADRDETYERFIELEYSYHLQEKTARTGYILHGPVSYTHLDVYKRQKQIPGRKWEVFTHESDCCSG